MLELKKNFSNKLDLLKRSRFLPRKVLLRFYFSVILICHLLSMELFYGAHVLILIW